MKTYLHTLLFLACSLGLQAQDYTSWFTGDTTDVITTNHLPGIVLAGGGGDHDNAMIWMLERAAGGDVLILRASNSDGYNNYFFSELGVTVNSVETIRFDGPGAASDPYVLRRIAEAEVLFFAGGDQYDYYEYWKDNEVEDAINSLIHDKQITVGGTSAGMAILGHVYYTPSSLGIISSEALSDPYHPYMDTLGKDDFLQAPFLENTVTDTHFDQRNRAGRLMTFMARITTDHGVRAKGIACNEFTAVAIDENGMARAFGEYPEYEEDQVYFLQANCMAPIEPELCEAGMPLDWNRNASAVKVYRIPAKWEGDHTFSVADWETMSGGFWEDWYVDQGTLQKVENADPADCSFWTSSEEVSISKIELFPNPVKDMLQVKGQGIQEVRIRNINGQILRTLNLMGTVDSIEIPVSNLQAGTYVLEIIGAQQQLAKRFVKI